MNKKLSIIIPVFNEKKTLPFVLDAVTFLKIPNWQTENIVVDDGSTDGTTQILKNYFSKAALLKKIYHKENLGKGKAIRTALQYIQGDYIIIQDADMEYETKYIQKLLTPIEKGEVEIVYGTRLKRGPHILREESSPLFFIHYFGNRLLSLIASVLYGQWLTDIETGYKVFSKDAISQIQLKAKGFEFEPEFTAKILKRGYKILEIPIQTTPRGYKEGKKLHTVKDGVKALWTLLKLRFID